MEGSATSARLTLTSLPPEILGEIFVQCSSQHPDSPLLLRQVSKSFQAIVHGTPRAWEHLTLHHRNNNTSASNATSDKARMWFKHSGSCFVHVRVEIEQPSLSIPKLWNAGNACQGAAAGLDAKDALTNALAAHVDRIRTLDVLAPSEPEARSLLDALYPSPAAFPSPTPLETPIPATQSISIRISSTTPPNLRLSSLASPSAFPLLPALRSLKLTNHTISFLSAAGGCDLGSLKELEIECPIRFQPIRVGEIMGILRRAGRLERLRVESRVVDDDNEVSSPSPSSSQMIPFSASGTASPTGSAAPTRPSTPPPTPSASSFSSSASLYSEEDTAPAPTPSLVHLPHLTSLSLRTNAIPALLSHLLLPNLAELKLEDLNGKRRGASAETAGVLRQLLVRMELPNEYRVGRGLRVLEVVGVDVQVPAVPVPTQELGLAIGARQTEEDATWVWCFKRMVSLEEIAVSKTDVAPVLEVLAPQASSPSSLQSQPSQRSSPIEPRPSSPFRSPSSTAVEDAQRSGDVDVVCPRLRRCTLSTSTPVSPLLVDRFTAQRPTVHLKVDVVQDPFFQSLKTGPVDFLSLYCDGPNSATRTVGVGETGGKGGAGMKPARRTGTRPAFGPWVVLA